MPPDGNETTYGIASCTVAVYHHVERLLRRVGLRLDIGRQGAYVTEATDNEGPTMPPSGNERLVGLETLLTAQHLFMPTGSCKDSVCDWRQNSGTHPDWILRVARKFQCSPRRHAQSALQQMAAIHEILRRAFYAHCVESLWRMA
jgi:hypothetical protein